MSYEFTLQLFWTILLPVIFLTLLLVPAAIGEFLLRRDYIRLIRLEAARERWAEIMERDDHAT